MIIRTLAENTTASDELKAEHGLSLYIETKKNKLLFDLGSSSLFAENAEKMGIDISMVDLVVISHGHYDHGGGLETFLSINSKAKIYLNKNAFGKYYSNRPGGEKKYIGLDETLQQNERFVFVGDRLVIDEELELFSGVKGDILNPSGNRDLWMKNGSVFMQDDFAHEQNLIITENGKKVLIAGCAHNGIVNILEHFQKDKKCYPDHVIGGFHLHNRSTGRSENQEVVKDIGTHLLSSGAEFFTCHCTGVEAYQSLKSMMGDKVEYLSTGSRIMI